MTTLIKMLMRALAPDQGTVRFFSSFESGDPQPDWTSTAETDAQGNRKMGGVTGTVFDLINGDRTALSCLEPLSFPLTLALNDGEDDGPDEAVCTFSREVSETDGENVIRVAFERTGDFAVSFCNAGRGPPIPFRFRTRPG